MKHLNFQITAFLFVLAAVPLCAQDGKYSAEQSSSTMSVLGTSTLHDWESMVEEFTASATMQGKSLQNVAVMAQVQSIKSGKSGMDSNTYKALSSKDYPTIDFTAAELTIAGSAVTGKGKLTIAGSTQDVSVDLKYEQWSEDSFQVIGEIPLKMTEFGVDPPTAMLGAIKTGDDITIKFEISMKK